MRHRLVLVLKSGVVIETEAYTSEEITMNDMTKVRSNFLGATTYTVEVADGFVSGAIENIDYIKLKKVR